MATDPKKPASDFSSAPLFSGDRATVPAAIETDSTTAWAEFERLQAGLSDDPPAEPAEAAFAPTAPISMGTVPAPAPTAPAPRKVSVQDVMVEARRFNRVCPKPAEWERLHALLPLGPNGRPAPAPISGAAWKATPAMPKRMRLRDQVEWADQYGGLDAVMAFLKGLSEQQWHHMDE